MENLKIRVNSADESKEAQELFFKLGGSWAGYKKIQDWPEIKQLYLGENYITFSNDINFFVKDHKEITLPELREMVNPMKEYLDANRNYEIVLCAEKDKEEGFIEIPEGAEALTKETVNSEETLLWWRDNFNKCIGRDDRIFNHEMDTYNHLERNPKPVILWQRDQDEPFLTPECTLNEHCSGTVKSYVDNFHLSSVERKIPEIHGTVRANPDFSDQYTEIEQVRQSAIKVSHNPNQQPKEIQKNSIEHTLAERQSTYGNFEDVAFVTENIMHILAKVRVNGLDDLPHTHSMALYMIASKMARIVNGDFNHLDSWHDIGGYSKLIEKLIKGE